MMKWLHSKALILCVLIVALYGRISNGFVAKSTHFHRLPTLLYSSSQQQDTTNIPSCIESPVLKQVYPFLIQHQQEFGHPNIPLGNSEGRKCETLRRLQIQKKLTEAEVTLLQDLGFRFDSLEDVYEKVDFNTMLERLLQYKEEFEAEGFQIPKKFAVDPELGAWVTGLRRLGPTGVDPAHAQALDKIGFVWKSNRKCGSAFMKQWREIRDRVQSQGESVLEEENIQKWVQAQRDANISETRGHYMAQLFGDDWRDAK